MDLKNLDKEFKDRISELKGFPKGTKKSKEQNWKDLMSIYQLKKRKIKRIQLYSIAASVIVVLGFSFLFYVINSNKNYQVQMEEKRKKLEEYEGYLLQNQLLKNKETIQYEIKYINETPVYIQKQKKVVILKCINC